MVQRVRHFFKISSNSQRIQYQCFYNFKEFFKADSLGTFSLAQDGAAGDPDSDNKAFTIDAKTGKLTSIYDFDFESTVDWSVDENPAGTNTAAGATIGESEAGTKFFQIQVTYTKRDTTTHVETIVLELKDNDAGEIRQRVCLNRDYLDFAGATLLPLPE